MKWEEIFFAVALAAFGWLLFSANGRAASASPEAASAPIDNASQVPWYLTFNQTAGYNGPLPSSQALNPANYIPVSNPVAGMQNAQGCSTCSTLPLVYS